MPEKAFSLGNTFFLFAGYQNALAKALSWFGHREAVCVAKRTAIATLSLKPMFS